MRDHGIDFDVVAALQGIDPETARENFHRGKRELGQQIRRETGPLDELTDREVAHLVLTAFEMGTEAGAEIVADHVTATLEEIVSK